MAEGRMLKKAVSDSRRLAELKTDSARLLWTWILPYLDIEGRYFADPDLIKGKVVPRIKTFNANNIAEYLADMAEVGLITLFEYDGEKYLEYRNFKKFQRLNPDRESKSQIPEPENSMSPQLVINEDYVNKKQLSDEDSCNTQQVINDNSANNQILINDDSVNTQLQLSENSGLFQEHSASTQRGLNEDSMITPPQFKLKLKTKAKLKINEDKLKISKDIVNDLNLVLGTSYKFTTPKTIELINARLNEGFTIDDFKTVHRKMLKSWGADPKMCKYLRPITLYGTKFESYLNSKESTTTLTESGIQAYFVGQEWLKKNGEKNA